MFSKFTANSVVLLGLTAFTVTVAAIFENPLLVYTAVFLVVTNVLLFIWAQLSVSGMKVVRRVPRLAIAKQPAEILIELTNLRRSARYGTLGFDLHQELTPGKDYTPVAFLDAPPLQPVEASYYIVPARRGAFKVGPFFLYGGDPFGFYKCWSKKEQFSELTVLPCPVAFSFQQPPSTSFLSQDELETVPVSGNSTEFLGVREYIEGEPLKRVHWRTSARLGRLISRQYELNVAASVSALVLADDAMYTGTKVDNPLEYSLTMVASLGHATLTERFRLSYMALTGERYETASGTGRGFYEELTVRLARLKGGGAVNWEKQGRVLLGYLPAGSHLVVFAARIDDALRGRLRQLAVHYRGLSVVTFDLDSFKLQRKAADDGIETNLGDGYVIYRLSHGAELGRVLSQCLGSPARRGVGRES
ncbi:DUF58 domain-containing protein [bacterium]|nr:DUF58 domain-containing protein [bacterium]